MIDNFNPLRLKIYTLIFIVFLFFILFQVKNKHMMNYCKTNTFAPGPVYSDVFRNQYLFKIINKILVC